MTATGDYTKQVHINRPRGRCSPHLRPRRSSAPGGRQPPDPQMGPSSAVAGGYAAGAGRTGRSPGTLPSRGAASRLPILVVNGAMTG